MDDIAGLKWTSTPANIQKPAPSTSNYSAFSALKPSPPTSGRASPFSQQSSQPPSKPATPANDSFANLVGFSTGSSKNLSLQEQQKKLLESKLKQQHAQSQVVQSQYSGGDDQFWNNLGSGRGTPALEHQQSRAADSKEADEEEDDLFAAFNKPPPTSKVQTASSISKPVVENTDDDDPFGLSQFANRRTNTVETTTTVDDDDDDDVLGLLGKPATARRRAPSPEEAAKHDEGGGHPQDKAVAELVDMGFPADRARQALETTESGLDVQNAVSYLLNQAHAEARAKTRSREAGHRDDSLETNTRVAMRQDVRPSQSRSRLDGPDNMRSGERDHGRAPEKDFEQMASEFGNNFLKTAGSFWKQGTKRVQQAVQDFSSDGEPNGAPKWMKEAEMQPSRPQQQTRRHPEEPVQDRPSRRAAEPGRTSQPTDEALMLESSRPTPPPKPPRIGHQDRPRDAALGQSRDHSPAMPSRLRETAQPQQPAFLRQQNRSPPVQPKSALNRQAAEEQAAQAYVSSARRRKPQPPASAPPREAGTADDLLESGFTATSQPAPRSKIVSTAPAPRTQPPRQVETHVRPPAPPRNIPPISPISLKAAHSHREKGNEHFKRGDYSSAHQAYATSITHLPETHPLVIVLFTNRALTALKTGEPKTAISDADKAIAVIGPSKGESEMIDFETGDTPKPMREYYGKALMRKAEALEQMEKWGDAAAIWREAVSGGHGGATAIAGRARSEKATRPTQPPKAPTPKPRASPAPSSAAAAISSLHTAESSRASAVAVSRLRAANAAAEKADDERFQLGDSVDARVQAWKGGKEGNLRALLGSLENVLWEGSGWKKISMADLVLPGKVKVQYMKGIARVHPDKIPTDATTEQRMIAGAVFAALNLAWDKFKAENGL